nr:MAG TPA: hypothetical protein [Caudoviricetes sp.]
MHFVYLSPPSLRNAVGFFSQGQTCNNVVFRIFTNNWFCIKKKGGCRDDIRPSYL